LIEALEEWEEASSLSVMDNEVASVVGVLPSWIELSAVDIFERLLVADVGVVG
jgi:hypothetical protein